MLSPLSVPKKTISSATYDEFMKPVRDILPDTPIPRSSDHGETDR